jgi:hypothetical protein
LVRRRPKASLLLDFHVKTLGHHDTRKENARKRNLRIISSLHRTATPAAFTDVSPVCALQAASTAKSPLQPPKPRSSCIESLHLERWTPWSSVRRSPHLDAHTNRESAAHIEKQARHATPRRRPVFKPASPLVPPQSPRDPPSSPATFYFSQRAPEAHFACFMSERGGPTRHFQ